MCYLGFTGWFLLFIIERLMSLPPLPAIDPKVRTIQNQTNVWFNLIQTESNSSGLNQTAKAEVPEPNRIGARSRKELNLFPQVIGKAFHIQSVNLEEKRVAHRWKETGINWPNGLSNLTLCFSDILTEGEDGSGGMSPSNWLGRNTQSTRWSGNGQSSRHSSSHLVRSFRRRQQWHLPPHYLRLRVIFRPFIWLRSSFIRPWSSLCHWPLALRHPIKELLFGMMEAINLFGSAAEWGETCI